MTFEEWWGSADIFDSGMTSAEEVWDAAWNAAIDEAVKASENCFSVNDDKNIISLEDYITDKIKKLKE